MDRQALALATFKDNVRQWVTEFYKSKSFGDFNGNFQTEGSTDLLHLNSKSNWKGTFNVDISVYNVVTAQPRKFSANAETDTPLIIGSETIKTQDDLNEFLEKCTKPKDPNIRYIVYSIKVDRAQQISLEKFTENVNESYELLDEIKTETKAHLQKKNANMTDSTPDVNNMNDENFTGSDWQHIIWTITFDPITEGIPKEINKIQISIDTNPKGHKHSRSVTVRAFKDSHKENDYDCDGNTYQNALRTIFGESPVYTNWTPVLEKIKAINRLLDSVQHR